MGRCFLLNLNFSFLGSIFQYCCWVSTAYRLRFASLFKITMTNLTTFQTLKINGVFNYFFFKKGKIKIKTNIFFFILKKKERFKMKNSHPHGVASSTPFLSLGGEGPMTKMGVASRHLDFKIFFFRFSFFLIIILYF